MIRRSVVTVALVFVSLLGLSILAPNVRASQAVNATAVLQQTCSNCATDVGSTYVVYSLLPDSFGAYNPTATVESQFLTHNAVYTLDTTNTLVNGLVSANTRTVNLHFFSPVEGSGGDVLPACWQGSHDQNQAVNWSIFSSNSTGFTEMQVGSENPGFSRLDFNVRSAQCNTQIYRYYLHWSDVCINRTSDTTWAVTSGQCGDAMNYGTASLYGQGGRHGQTVYYGDWREPFQIVLTTQSSGSGGGKGHNK